MSFLRALAILAVASPIAPAAALARQPAPRPAPPPGDIVNPWRTPQPSPEAAPPAMSLCGQEITATWHERSGPKATLLVNFRGELWEIDERRCRERFVADGVVRVQAIGPAWVMLRENGDVRLLHGDAVYRLFLGMTSFTVEGMKVSCTGNDGSSWVDLLPARLPAPGKPMKIEELGRPVVVHPLYKILYKPI